MMDKMLELRDMLIHALGSDVLIEHIEDFFGTSEMIECYEDIAKTWDVI